MRELEQLQKQWNDSARFRGVQARLCLDDDGLTLGAGTVVAKRNHDGSLAIDGEEARVLTLLSVAYGQPLDSSALKTIRRASALAREGDECKAAMHIALARLPKISDSSDAARRLFIAEGLIAAGVAPRDIWKALEFDSSILDSLAKYNQDEPRVPAGSGRPSGQWTSGGAASPYEALLATARLLSQQAMQEAARDAPEVAATAARQAPALLELLPEIVATSAGPIALLAGVLIPTPAGGKRLEGDVPGHPELRFSWTEDETTLKISRKSDGKVLVRASLQGGEFRDENGRVIARIVGDKVTVDPENFFPRKMPGPGGDSGEDRNFCPAPGKDKAGRPGPTGDPDRDYEDYVKSYVNPLNQTPRGMGYQLPNPQDAGKPVFYDDCQRKTGILVEAKGKTYSELFEKTPQPARGVIDKMMSQAKAQVQASQGRPIVWFFAEEAAAAKARELFNSKSELERIQVIYLPMPGWAP